MKPEKKVVILQSNYIPWKGYFDLLNTADEFIIYDEVQYTVNDWRNRNKIKAPQGAIWLTIPVIKKNHLEKKINEMEVQDLSWRKKHFSSICHYYSKTTFFKHYKSIFEELYLGSDETNLSKINLTFIKAINEILNIKTKVSSSTKYKLLEGKTERIVDLCKQAGAKEYISGPAAAVYIDEKLFKKENINLVYFDYSNYKQYTQLYGDFEHNVSIIDLIFNEGENASNYMKSFN